MGIFIHSVTNNDSLHAFINYTIDNFKMKNLISDCSLQDVRKNLSHQVHGNGLCKTDLCIVAKTFCESEINSLGSAFEMFYVGLLYSLTLKG